MTTERKTTEESVCVRIFTWQKFISLKWGSISVLRKHRRKGQGKEMMKPLIISLSQNPLFSSFLSIHSHVPHSPPSTLSFTTCLIAAELWRLETHKFDNESLHCCDNNSISMHVNSSCLHSYLRKRHKNGKDIK